MFTFFFKKTPLESSLSLCYFICLFFDYKYDPHLLLFSLIVVAFLACTYEAVHIQHSFEFFCVLSGLAQKIPARCNKGSYVFSFFFNFIFILFLALPQMHLCVVFYFILFFFLIPSTHSLRFGSRM